MDKKSVYYTGSLEAKIAQKWPVFTDLHMKRSAIMRHRRRLFSYHCRMKTTTNQPKQTDDFTQFMRKLVSVPHTEIKARLEAEKRKKRTSKPSASRASGA